MHLRSGDLVFEKLQMHPSMPVTGIKAWVVVHNDVEKKQVEAIPLVTEAQVDTQWFPHPLSEPPKVIPYTKIVNVYRMVY